MARRCSTLALPLACFYSVILAKALLEGQTDPRCDLVGWPGTLAPGIGPSNYSWEVYNVTIDPVQVVGQPPDTYTYDVNTTSNMSFIVVDPIKNTSAFCSGVTEFIDDDEQYRNNCSDESGELTENPWLSFYFLADKSLYLSINETWICGDGTPERTTVEATGGANFRWFSCNGSAYSTYFPTLGSCIATTYPNNHTNQSDDFSPGTGWTYLNLDLEAETLVTIPPPPNKNCTAASESNPSWLVTDFVLNSGLESFNAYLGVVGPWGTVQFTLFNMANNYSANMTCYGADEYFNLTVAVNVNAPSSWFYCSVANARDYDALPTDFIFDPRTGNLMVQQSWTCDDGPGGQSVTYSANGTVALTLVDGNCTTLQGSPDGIVTGSPLCNSFTCGEFGPIEQCLYEDATIRATLIDQLADSPPQV